MNHLKQRCMTPVGLAFGSDCNNNESSKVVHNFECADLFSTFHSSQIALVGLALHMNTVY